MTGEYLESMDSSAQKRPALDATGHEQVGFWWPGILQPKRPSSTVNNHLGVIAAQGVGPSEAVKPTTSAVVPFVRSSTCNPDAYDGQSLTVQWMTTMPGALTVIWLQGQPVPSPPGYAISSYLPDPTIWCLGFIWSP